MNILRSYKRTRFFLWVNITGLAIGLAVSIMLILFVVNELSYDKHFANSERIVRLITVWEGKDQTTNYAINMRKAYTELPAKIPGVETAVQLYRRGTLEVTREKERFQNVRTLCVDPEFFNVFQMTFVEGNAQTALDNTNSIVLTRRQADIIFGDSHSAINQILKISDQDYTVSAVVENLPANTHFSFDALLPMQSISHWMEGMQGLEFLTYYLISPDASPGDVRIAIEKEYSSITAAFGEAFNAKIYGKTDKLTDVYLHSDGFSGNIGRMGDIRLVWLLSGLSLFILLLAVSNFINLFIAQGETRMREIGIRKTNGAAIADIVRQFFSEVSGIVLIAFIIGVILTIILAPYFSELIHREIDMAQLWNPSFILSAIGLFIMTVVSSAFYPALYLSRFSPLDILGKRIRFSKRRLMVGVVIFQSIITIVLVSFIMIVNSQTNYLKNIPLGYNPENVVTVPLNRTIYNSFDAIRQELLSVPEIKQVSAAQHTFGGGYSGQRISLLDNKEERHGIGEYRIMPGICELMELQLLEGDFFKENAPDSVNQIVLNEAAVKMLGLSYPVAGKSVMYTGGITEIVGVAKDFCYAFPADKIEPMALSKTSGGNLIYIRFREGTDRKEAIEKTLAVFHQFDPDFILNSTWSEDIYTGKFETFTTTSKVITLASLLSIFIAMLGLVAIHLYTTVRRTKEIGIRRINGANSSSIFNLLTGDIVKWIVIAGIVAVPIIYYMATNMLNEYSNHTSLNWTMFVIPILIQCIIAILATSGVTLWALHQNPVNALKKE
ncbi:Acidobacterial duplicated orphan permease [Proteiniphilum saccharofermentans]|uniref:Acidobacterial duplicated orphan permease n=1 Tax=Proteiniphilum saccharofermentans TaxID=1642647 RepID=A0A1R3T124_9BACT|nr:ABC transporter permease [Proteiniphilum saccharofermentans]SCD22106.1 Acidobacterial duplicated orphan permease [Proteiniphilum saccharofermentans]